jgi:signal transduction histidine kinase
MRRRILALTLAVTAAALIVFGVPLGWAVGRVYRTQQLTRLQQAATTAAAAVPAEGLHGADPVEPPPVPSTVGLAYYDAGGHLASGAGPPSSDAQVRQALAGRPSQGSSGSRLAAVVPITANEATIGAVEATSPSGPVAARVGRTWLGMLALGLVALGVAGTVAVRQSRRVVAPLDDLVDAATRLGDGEFAVQTPRSGIIELDRAAVALEETSTRLGDLIEREQAFTAHASHQLRTPLTALRLDLEGAIETPGGDLRSAVTDAIGEVDRFQATLEELLALARTGMLPGRQVRLADILTPLEQRWHARLARDGRRLHVLVDDSTSEQPAPATLAQILDVLVDNATIHGRGTVTVTTTATRGSTTIDIQDEGAGMPAVGPGEDLKVGSEPAVHGVGMRLARSLAEAAGGRLVVKHRGPNPVVAVVLPEPAVPDR